MTKVNKTELLITPITNQPEYKAANDQLGEFVKQRKFMQMSLDSINGKIALHDAKLDEGDAITRASNMINGVVDSTLHDQAKKLTQSIMILDKAIIAQRDVITGIRHTLGADISKELMPLHKAITARIAKAIEELSKANSEEIELRAAAAANGYLAIALPTMAYLGAYSLEAADSSIAFYWLKEAEKYLA